MYTPCKTRIKQMTQHNSTALLLFFLNLSFLFLILPPVPRYSAQGIYCTFLLTSLQLR